MNGIDSVSIFEHLSPDELDGLRHIAVMRRYPPATIVFREADPSDALYVIQSGYVRVYRITEDGKEKTFGIRGAGDILGEIGLLDGQPRSATLETLEQTVMLQISGRDFRQHAIAHPEILFKIQKSMCSRLRAMMDDLVEVSFRDLRSRLLCVLVYLCEKHGQETTDGCRIGLRLQQKELAGMIGANRESVSRLMTRLDEENLVHTIRGHFLIPDLKALCQAWGGPPGASGG